MTVDPSRYRWHEPGTLGTMLRVLLVVAGLGSMVVGLLAYVYLRRHSLVVHIPEASSPQIPTVVGWPDSPWITVLSIPSLVSQATVVVWLIWQHQVTANLWARGFRDLRTSPGWAVGWWFIPVANLAMPLVAMLEVDRRSAPEGRPRRASLLLGWWWAAWLAYSLLPLIGFFGWVMPAFVDWAQTVDEGASTLDLTSVASSFAPWIVLGGVLQAMAGIFASEVVARIDRSQRAIAAAPVPVPPRPDL